ncbi:pentapeptide repeat-containing protein [Nostoc sp.]|uniref:pentapeptide repeat-containing protein n=1 Tax=Nostoc sp. TaxID=1180 RepID=UPI002FF9CCC3
MGRSCRASTNGLEKAKQALKIKGWTQEYLAGFAKCSRPVVINFFARRPVDQNKFQTICHELGLEWGDVAELETGQLSANMNAAQNNTNEIIQESSGITQLLNPPVSTTEEKSTRTRKAMIVLSAKLTADNQAQLQDKKIEVEAIVAHLRQLVGDVTLTIKDIEEGSIKITLEGSSEGIERLRELFESGELTEALGIPLEDIQLLTDDVTQKNDDKTRLVREKYRLVREKYRLVKEILVQGAIGRDLSRADLRGADLRGADLRGADLIYADLRGADLIYADLSNADLRGADLRYANLSGANLSDANLRIADLRIADLSNADLSNADLSNADLSNADLSNADLSNADLIGAYLIDADLSSTNLSGANINEKTQIDSKWRLVWEIVNQGAKGRDLSNADLSDADLSDADLSDADLSRANLSRANLSRANLSRANLSSADLKNAIVANALFKGSTGLTKDMRHDLEKRGAIFGDRPPVLSRR